ncbi:MAG: response regulator [Candidatus Krumholzibacteriia bacterium]
MSFATRVLLVDDSIDDNFIHTRLLRRTGFTSHVEVMKDGLDALAYLRGLAEGTAAPAELPQIVFLDLRMPRLDGFEFLAEFEKLPADFRRRVVVVVLTSSLLAADRERASSLSSRLYYLVKPLTRQQLEDLKTKLDHPG